jgi:hypothetical protein
MGTARLVKDADLHPFLIVKEGDIYGTGNMVLLVFQRGADIDNTVGIEKCFTKYRDGGQGFSPESSMARRHGNQKRARTVLKSCRMTKRPDRVQLFRVDFRVIR